MYKRKPFLVVLAAALLVSTGAASGQTDMGTAFTYQGELIKDDGAVVHTCDFDFTLWDVASGEGSVATMERLTGVSVEGGRFTVTLDFGAGAFNGDARWLEIAVCCPSGCDPETLQPRQELTPTPYAIYAEGEDYDWEVSGSDVFTGHGGLYPSGNVGIGMMDITNPSYWSKILQVYGEAHSAISVRNISKQWDMGAASGGDLRFVEDDVVRLTINPGGNVGIGTTSITNPTPWSKILQIYDYEHSAISVRNHGKQWDMGAASGGDLRFNEDGTSRVTIQPGGNVGIGTTSIANPSVWDKILQIYDDDHSAISVRNNSKQWDMGAASGGDLRFNEDGVSRLTIKPGGDVGIGTTGIANPSEWLTILQVYGEDHSAISVRNNSKQWDMGAASGGDLRFNEDDTSRLTIKPGGNVGIGTTEPQAKLDVNGPTRTETLEITGGSPLEQALAGWGYNGSGATNVPTGTFTGVAGGGGHSLAIRSDGTLAGWGYNNYGQSDVPTGTFTAVSGGHFHSLAIRSDGTLAGWGYNIDGQTDVPTGTFTAVAAGDCHSLAIRSDGTLAGWGYNNNGQTDVPTGTFTAVAAGWEHSLAIRSDGTLAGWGSNSWGQTDVPAGTFTAVAAGVGHSLAIRSDGTLAGWGMDNYGQTDVPTGTFTAVAGGGHHSLAIGTDPTGFGLLLATDSAFKPGTNTWTILSDRRLKKNIHLLGGALDRLLQLQGVSFEWIDAASQGGRYGPQIGLIADQVESVFPDWVGRDPSGYKTLTIGGFEALTTEALRQLREEKRAEIESLRAEKDADIAELEARLAVLEEAIAAIGQETARQGGVR